MARMHMLVEGVTERLIVRNIIEPHLRSLGWWVTDSIIRTAPLAAGPGHHGGVVSWRQVEREVRRSLGTPSFAVVTPTIADRLRIDVEAAGGAELVNDGRTTAPSKRPKRYRPDYLKVNDGPLVISELGLDALRARCPHLDAWLHQLKA